MLVPFRDPQAIAEGVNSFSVEPDADDGDAQARLESSAAR